MAVVELIVHCDWEEQVFQGRFSPDRQAASGGGLVLV